MIGTHWVDSKAKVTQFFLLFGWFAINNQINFISWLCIHDYSSSKLLTIYLSDYLRKTLHWSTIRFELLEKKWMKTRFLLDWGFWYMLELLHKSSTWQICFACNCLGTAGWKPDGCSSFLIMSPTRDTYHLPNRGLWHSFSQSGRTQAPSICRRLNFSAGTERNKLQGQSCSYFRRGVG